MTAAPARPPVRSGHEPRAWGAAAPRSRDAGRLQVARSGAAWKWPGARRYSLASYAGDTDIRAYEAGRRVPVWMLLRDIGCSRADLSRALGGLKRQQMVLRFGSDLDAPGLSRSCKFVCITSQGDTWLKSKQMRSGKIGSNAEK